MPNSNSIFELSARQIWEWKLMWYHFVRSKNSCRISYRERIRNYRMCGLMYYQNIYLLLNKIRITINHKYENKQKLYFLIDNCITKNGGILIIIIIIIIFITAFFFIVIIVSWVVVVLLWFIICNRMKNLIIVRQRNLLVIYL